MARPIVADTCRSCPALSSADTEPTASVPGTHVRPGRAVWAAGHRAGSQVVAGQPRRADFIERRPDKSELAGKLDRVGRLLG